VLIVDKIKIMMVSTSFPRKERDWQGIFIRNMVNSISALDKAEVSLWSPPGPIGKSIRYACSEKESDWLVKLSDMGGIAHLLRSSRFRGLFSSVRLLYFLRRVYRRMDNVDIFHVNWLQNALPLLGTNKPLLVTVLGADLKLLDVPCMTPTLRAVFSRRPTIVAPNADWMVPGLKRRFGRTVEIRAIPFGIDKHWFHITRNPDFQKPLRWIVISRVTRQKLGTLLKWGERVFTGGHELHLLGPMQESLALPPWIHYHGPTHPEVLRRLWFPEAAGLVTLSRHSEGRPQVILEAMAAGMPILASTIDAHRDVVRDGETGRLIATAEDLARAVGDLADPDENQRVGASAKEWVRRHIGTWEDGAARFVRAYGDLLDRTRP
jgi:glycosyltransferase involved in cell wall biosynthesis